MTVTVVAVLVSWTDWSGTLAKRRVSPVTLVLHVRVVYGLAQSR